MNNPNAVARSLNNTVAATVGCRLVEGELFGIELELEGQGVKLADVPTKGWKRHADGSLRGESIEYVSSRPTSKQESIDNVKRLYAAFVKHKVSLKNSYRCSTHIHVNFSDRKLKDVVNFFCVFTLIEELLTTYCGPERSGNLFCLSSRDVEGVVKLLQDSITQHGNFVLFDDNVRYCAVNLAALNKFGTIELRTMRGANSAEQVTDWLEIVSQLYTYATQKMESPAKLVENLSRLGAEGLLREIFDKACIEKLMATWDGRDLLRSFYDGARLIQVFAYRIDDAFNIKVAEEPQNEKRYVLFGGQIEEPLGRRHMCANGRIITFNPATQLWYDDRTGVALPNCDRFGVVLPFPRAEAERRPIPNNMILENGRILYVPGVARHGEQCPGVEHILYNREAGYWENAINGNLLPFCNARGVILDDPNDPEDIDDEEDDDYED